MKILCTEGKLDPDADLAVRQIMDAAEELVMRINSLHGKGIEVHTRVDRQPDGSLKLIGLETQPVGCGVVVHGRTPYVAVYQVEGVLG